MKESGTVELQLPGSCLSGVQPTDGFEYNRIEAAQTQQAAVLAEAAGDALIRVRCDRRLDVCNALNPLESEEVKGEKV